MNTEDKKENTPQAEETGAEEVKAEQQEPAEAAPAEETADKKGGRKDKKAEKSKEKNTAAAPPRVEDSPEYEALNDKYLRICAEYDNFRRRSQKEKDSLYGDIKADTLKKFLPVYDNLVRALEQPTEDEAYRKGVEMIMTQFTDTLEKLGATKIESLGKTFDPALHNAVMHEDNEEKGENEIIQVFQEGFMIGDKVVRFAMVKVAN